MASGIANFLPGLLALLAVLMLFLLLASLVRMLLKRSLRGINFDSRLDQWGFSWVAEWTPSRSPTQLIARLSFWTIVFLGAMAGASALDADLPSQLAYRLFAYLPNVLAAMLVLGVGTFLARFLSRGVLISAVNMQIHSARLLGLGVKWLILLLAGAMAMEHLGIGGQIVRHPVRGHRAGARFGRGPGLQRHSQPHVGTAGQPERGTDRGTLSSSLVPPV